MTNWLKQFWPELLAVLAVIVDEALKAADQFASSHEHASVAAVLVLVLLRRLQTWLSGKSGDTTYPPGTGANPVQGRRS